MRTNVDILQDRGGKRENLCEVAQALQFDTEDLLPVADTAQLQHLISISEGAIEMTADGCKFAVANILTRKRIFRDKVMENVPFARKIHDALAQQTRHFLAEEFFEDILDEHLTEGETERQMDTIIDWGVTPNSSSSMQHAKSWFSTNQKLRMAARVEALPRAAIGLAYPPSLATAF